MRLWPILALAWGFAHPAPAADPWSDPDLAAQLREGVRHNDDGDYDAAEATWRRLAESAPLHPAPHVHAVDTLFWRQVQEDDDGDYDEAILRESELAIAKSEAWAKARPDDARAHFYLGQALISLGRLHGIRARLYRAGSLGERGREALERALELDPSLQDAKFSLGLYAYYASLVPEVFQWLNFLWFVPKGDAATGLRQLEEAWRGGDLYRFTGGFFLAHVLTYHEQESYARAFEILRSLHDAHPHNSMVHFELVELLITVEDYERAIQEALALEAHPGTARHDRGRANMARIWRARARLLSGQPERAWEILQPFGAEGPEEPDWGSRWVRLTRGQILDVQGERERAIAQYESVAWLDLPGEPRSRERARAGLEKPFVLDAAPEIGPRAREARGRGTATASGSAGVSP